RLEGALREREEAVESLRTALAELQQSDDRLHGLLDTAVDGVVELGPDDTIVRANDAFRSMIGLGSERLEGRTWAEVGFMAAAEIPLAALRTNGHAVIETERRALHLEARTSTVPTDPPGSLLLVRDVTASTVA